MLDIREDLRLGAHCHAVLDRLWVGDLIAADWALDEPAWSVLNVLEDVGSMAARYQCIERMHQPILAYGHAQPSYLNLAARWIWEQFDQERPVLVHCVAGIERSPLTVAWALARRRAVPLSQAYAWVKAVRPQIADRTAWLPPGWERWLGRVVTPAAR